MTIVRAFTSTIRVSVLKMMSSGDRLSPVRAAERLELPVNRVSYHMRELERHGALEVVETIPRRGAVEHVYALTDLGRLATRRLWVCPRCGLTRDRPGRCNAGHRNVVLIGPFVYAGES